MKNLLVGLWIMAVAAVLSFYVGAGTIAVLNLDLPDPLLQTMLGFVVAMIGAGIGFIAYALGGLVQRSDEFRSK